MICVRSSLGQEQSYAYDAVGNVISMTDTLGHVTHYTYSPGGKLTSVLDAAGNRTEYAYDSMGELITYADGRSVALTYNPLRQLIEIQDWLGTTRIEMDDAGRTEKVIDYEGREIAYEWNRDGQREAILYPNGKKVAYEYDDFSRLSHLVDEDREIHYRYDADGRLAEKNYSDGITSSYSYNPMGLLSGFVHQKEESILEQYAFEYDKMGNKTAIRKTRQADTASISQELERKLQKESGSYHYQYDSLNRLTQVSKNKELLRNYEYDAFGNRIQQETATMRERYHYNAANQLIRSEGIFPEASYQYDLRGNLTGIYHGKELVNHYVYDETNRLSEAVNANGEAAKYQYDGLGNRVGVKEYQFDKTSVFRFHKIQPESDLFENPTREVDYLLDRTKAYHNLLEKTEITEGSLNTQTYTWDANVAFMTEGESAHIYLQDELGSPVRLLGMGEKDQTVYGYDEFGQDLYGTQGDVQPFGYTGYRKDRIAGTYFAQAREYLAGVGRFGEMDINPGDTVIPISLNRYSYCYCNGLKYVDCNGKTPKEPDVFDKYPKAKNYIPNTSIGLSPDQALADKLGYPLSENFIPNTSLGPPDPNHKFYTIDKYNDKIINVSIQGGKGVYVKGKVLDFGVEGGAKWYYIFDKIDPAQWKEAIDIGAGASAGPFMSGEVGYHAEKYPYFDYMDENGLYIDGNVLNLKRNENGDYILNLIDLGGYIVVGGEISVDMNVSKLLNELETKRNKECQLSK